jgi:hypothetical protein
VLNNCPSAFLEQCLTTNGGQMPDGKFGGSVKNFWFHQSERGPIRCPFLQKAMVSWAAQKRRVNILIMPLSSLVHIAMRALCTSLGEPRLWRGLHPSPGCRRSSRGAPADVKSQPFPSRRCAFPATSRWPTVSTSLESNLSFPLAQLRSSKVAVTTGTGGQPARNQL